MQKRNVQDYRLQRVHVLRALDLCDRRIRAPGGWGGQGLGLNPCMAIKAPWQPGLIPRKDRSMDK